MCNYEREGYYGGYYCEDGGVIAQAFDKWSSYRLYVYDVVRFDDEVVFEVTVEGCEVGYEYFIAAQHADVVCFGVVAYASGERQYFYECCVVVG